MKRYWVVGPFVEDSEAARRVVSKAARLVVRAEDAEKLEEENEKLRAENGTILSATKILNGQPRKKGSGGRKPRPRTIG